ncbi:ExbD/TolR family protein [Neisseriaceae bacterium TC5R-5]|nr:ExbD/TolR family protein [Neisseriaceae bacterium TC5R-5]
MLNRRPRRQINQMNVVPYIDVMLVLLVIFMVTAPMFTPGAIDVPSVSQAASLDTRPLEVTVDADGKLQLIDDQQTLDMPSLDTLSIQIKQRLANTPERPVAISADASLKYAQVIQIADQLHQAGIKRVALTVKQQTRK